MEPFQDNLSPAFYIFQITISLNLVIQAISELEMNIVAAERVEEYTALQPEVKMKYLALLEEPFDKVKE